GVGRGGGGRGKGDFKKAEEGMGKAVQKEPKSGRVLRAYAGWLLEQGRLKEARTQADAAAKYDPKSKDTEKLRGLVARHLQEHAAAEQIFEALHKEAPADFFAGNQLALVLADRQQDKDSLRRALQLAEANARQHPRS